MIENGAETIWELKTGKRRWSADQLEFDPQPTTYGIAARELGFTDAKSKILVTLKWVKPDVQVEDLVRHHRDERELAEIALGVHHAVQAGVDFPNRGWQCKTCPYAGVCSLSIVREPVAS